MNFRTLAIATTLAASALFAAPALAENRDDMSFTGMAAVEECDANKDGMVTKKEFLNQMSKVWDSRAKKVTLKNGAMTASDYDKMVLMYLKAGG